MQGTQSRVIPLLPVNVAQLITMRTLHHNIIAWTFVEVLGRHHIDMHLDSNHKYRGAAVACCDLKYSASVMLHRGHNCCAIAGAVPQGVEISSSLVVMSSPCSSPPSRISYTPAAPSFQYLPHE